MKLHLLNLTNFKIDGGAMFGVVPKVLWQKKYPADEHNLCNWALRVLLLVDGDKKILVDNGFGDKQDEKFFSNYHLNGGESLENQLSSLGLSPADITDMVHTHLHFDHCGGGVKRIPGGDAYQLSFPNATYWVSQAQWEAATKPNAREAASFLPENVFPIEESGKLRFIDEQTKIHPSIRFRLYHGHTAGQVIPFIDFKNRVHVFASDLLPSAAHLSIPWIMSYDMEPRVTLKEKEDFLREAAREKHVILLQHDLYRECIVIGEKGKGFEVVEESSL
jgi:glyoxylase-like metal-dependent hydrolase (beta-lactamase superfamily II)